MNPEEEFNALVRECGDSAILTERMEWLKANHPRVSKLCGLKAIKGWSEQHFLASCVVVLATPPKQQPPSTPKT